jgi:hypothetical protein
MMKKFKKEAKAELAPIKEPVEPTAVEAPKAVSPKKEAVKPLLMIEEVARDYVSFRPQHVPIIVAFCNSRGFPTKATEEELMKTLAEFGWPASRRRKPR